MPRDAKTPGTAEGFVRLILAQPFLDEVRRQRVDPEPAIRAIGLEPEAVSDPDRFVHAEIMYGLFNALAEAAQDRYLGYHVGERVEFAHWPPFQKATQEARSLGEFLTGFIAAVPSEANSVRHRLEIDVDGACYRVERYVQTRNSPQHTEGFGVAHFLRLFQAVSGPTWDPGKVVVRMQYAAAVPPDAQGIRVEGKSEGGLEVHFPTQWLHVPIDLHSRLSQAQGRPDRQSDEDVSVLVAFRSAARPLLSDLGTGLAEVAAALGLDPATLDRALRREGTSAVREIRKLRTNAAKSALSDPTRAISAIAGDLGYSDPAHFSRFFKSQTGQSPRAYRKAMAQTG